jgi:hypothetical protein
LRVKELSGGPDIVASFVALCRSRTAGGSPFGKPRRAKEGSRLMSILGRIVSSIFGHASAAPASGTAAAPGSPAKPAASAPSSSAAPASTTKPGTPVDVTSILDKLAASNKEKLGWRHSIIDLMKLLNLDSSLAARKELAEELHFTGDKNDSASMNIWLHKQVMVKLAENGGKVPDELRK